MEKEFDYLKEIVEPGIFDKWQEVDIIVYHFTDLGMNVAINNEYKGVVYENEIYAEYKLGQRLKAFIKEIRPDGKIDVSLQPSQGKHVFSTTDEILAALETAGGKLSFNDKTSPEDIKNKFQISKRVFKQAIGKLYKQRKIVITDEGIELVV